MEIGKAHTCICVVVDVCCVTVEFLCFGVDMSVVENVVFCYFLSFIF